MLQVRCLGQVFGSRSFDACRLQLTPIYTFKCTARRGAVISLTEETRLAVADGEEGTIVVPSAAQNSDSCAEQTYQSLILSQCAF